MLVHILPCLGAPCIAHSFFEYPCSLQSGWRAAHLPSKFSCLPKLVKQLLSWASTGQIPSALCSEALDCTYYLQQGSALHDRQLDMSLFPPTMKMTSELSL
uniref:Uncharacterized protein n=1 Tax=Sphaerodactylus townsendi TaxID=933632 RepID=A0ACB8GE26_9SAUR